ncbi:MAG: DUF4082 domain-containing protein [Lacipirellulaceae bacterium]
MTSTTLRLNSVGWALTLAAAALTAPVAHAVDVPAFSIAGDNKVFIDPNVTTGFRFTALQTVSVTALGFHDDQLNGLVSSHDVALYNTSGTQLVLATVPAGTGAPLIGEYRYAALSSAVELQAGTQYVLAAYTNNNDGYRAFSTPTADPRISIVSTGAFYNYGPSLAFPTTTFAAASFYATPNMLLEAVPEPGTAVLLCAGLAAVACRRCR